MPLVSYNLWVMQGHLKIRPIRKEDNKQVARLIREVMQQYQCVGEGYSIEDPEVDNMFEYYEHDRAMYFVIADETGKVYGGGGIDELSGGDGSICELKKMYFYPEIRGKGFGIKMVNTCIEKANALGFETCYLETVERMTEANGLYKKLGFAPLEKNMGCTGHSSCDAFYAKEI